MATMKLVNSCKISLKGASSLTCLHQYMIIFTHVSSVMNRFRNVMWAQLLKFHHSCDMVTVKSKSRHDSDWSITRCYQEGQVIGKHTKFLKHHQRWLVFSDWYSLPKYKFIILKYSLSYLHCQIAVCLQFSPLLLARLNSLLIHLCKLGESLLPVF